MSYTSPDNLGRRTMLRLGEDLWPRDPLREQPGRVLEAAADGPAGRAHHPGRRPHDEAAGDGQEGPPPGLRGRRRAQQAAGDQQQRREQQ